MLIDQFAPKTVLELSHVSTGLKQHQVGEIGVMPTRANVRRRTVSVLRQVKPGTWLVWLRSRDPQMPVTAVLRWRVGDRMYDRVLHGRGRLPKLYAVQMPVDGHNLSLSLLERKTEVGQAGLIGPGLFARLLWSAYIRLEAAWRLLMTPKATSVPAKAVSLPTASNATRLDDVSIILPTRDNPAFVQGLWRAALGPALAQGAEIVVLDHASIRPEALATYRDLAEAGAKLLRFDGPFNYSRMINAGVRASLRPILLTLNDDIVLESAGSIAKLAQIVREGGADIVSPQLVYPDGTLQHGGVAIGMGGLAGHYGRFRTADAEDTYGLFSGQVQVSCVTGAAMVLSRQIFDQLSGFDEKLAVELNDIDFCLRAGAFGAICLVDHDVKLVHLESVTRGDPILGENSRRIRRDRNRFLARWADRLCNDGYFPKELDLSSEHIRLSFPPSV